MAKKKEIIPNDNNNAICYYRYSSEAQNDKSIEQQQEEAKRYCDEHGYHIIKEYADRAMSGANFDRPEFQMMLNDVKNLRPGHLILWKGDRLSRNRLDAQIAKKIIRDAGVKIEYVSEYVPVEEAEMVLIEGMQETFAEFYLVQLKHNVTRGLKYNAEQALYNGHKILGYKGERKKKYEIDEKTAPIIQRIFNDYADGKPMKVIADELNKAGYTTVREKPFTEKSLWHTLSNRSYIGEYRWGEIVVPDGFPPLVSIEDFERVQDMMQKNKHGGRGGAKKLQASTLEGIDFWLTGHLFCGECGASLCGSSGTGSKGKLYYYYTCTNRKKHNCKKKNVRKDDIESVVANVLEECLNDSALRLLIAQKVYEYYMQENSSDDSYEKSLVENIKDIDKKLKNILNAIEAGIFNDTTKERMQELEEQKRLYSDELVVEQNRQKYALKPEHVVRYLECFVGNLNEPSLREKVLDYLIENIYLYDDKVVINFYYSEDKREINFAEFKEHLDSVDRIMKIMDGDTLHTDSYSKKLNAMWESIIAKDEDDESF